MKKTRCPHCETDNREGAECCHYCGHDIPPQNGASREETLRSSDVVGHAWLVVGECGEYSYARKWNVRGYRTEAEAVAHAEAAQAVADSLKRKYEKNWWDAEGEENPHDPQYASDYTGTSYRVEMVVLGAWPTAGTSPQSGAEKTL